MNQQRQRGEKIGETERKRGKRKKWREKPTERRSIRTNNTDSLPTPRREKHATVRRSRSCCPWSSVAAYEMPARHPLHGRCGYPRGPRGSGARGHRAVRQLEMAGDGKIGHKGSERWSVNGVWECAGEQMKIKKSPKGD